MGNSPKPEWVVKGGKVDFASNEASHKDRPGKDITVRYDEIIFGLPQVYFEATVVSLPNSGVIAIGLAPHDLQPGQLPGWQLGSFGYHSDDGHLYHSDGQKGQKFGPTFSEGDIIGCGVSHEDKLFFTLQSKILETQVIIKNPRLYPVIGFDHPGTTVAINLAPAKNPLGPPPAPPKSLPGGQLQLPSPFKQNQPFLSLPQDIFSLVVKYGVHAEFLETCRLAYVRFAPCFHWVDVIQLKSDLVGYYADLTKQRGRAPWTFGIEIKSDGTFDSKYLDLSPPQKPFEGTWEVKRQACQVDKHTGHPILPWDTEFAPGQTKIALKSNWFSVVQLSFKRKDSEGLSNLYYVKQLDNCRVSTRDEAITNLPQPRYWDPNAAKKKCGVPLELQTAEKDCCYEVIGELIDSVWNSELDERLGCEVKSAITARVSLQCMKPGGMYDHEIKIAIAEEIANCEEWKASFESVRALNL